MRRSLQEPTGYDRKEKQFRRIHRLGIGDGWGLEEYFKHCLHFMQERCLALNIYLAYFLQGNYAEFSRSAQC